METTNKLELKEIVGYLPHGLKIIIPSWERSGVFKVHKFAQGFDYNNREVSSNWIFRNIENGLKPILRPMSDLSKPIMVDGKEIVPIIELAKLTGERASNLKWSDGDMIVRMDWEDMEYPAYSQIKLYDFLNQLHFDYRGLIAKGLAIDINTIKE